MEPGNAELNEAGGHSRRAATIRPILRPFTAFWKRWRASTASLTNFFGRSFLAKVGLTQQTPAPLRPVFFSTSPPLGSGLHLETGIFSILSRTSRRPYRVSPRMGPDRGKRIIARINVGPAASMILIFESILLVALTYGLVVLGVISFVLAFAKLVMIAL